MDPRLDTGGWLTLTGGPLDSSFPTGTFTLQGAPSFAWRTNILISDGTPFVWINLVRILIYFSSILEISCDAQPKLSIKYLEKEKI
jgi:hypothetical protein